MHYLIHSFQLSQEVEFLQFKQQIEDNCQRRQWHPTPVLLPGKSHGRRSLVGCSPWGHWELDTTQRLHFDFSLSCIGEVNGNPLQCSCLENPRDGGAWWAAVHGVAQSRTWQKWLSSSSKAFHWLVDLFVCFGFKWFIYLFIIKKILTKERIAHWNTALRFLPQLNSLCI